MAVAAGRTGEKVTAPYFPFYASDWLAGTRGLTAAETGVYITLIALMYERDGILDIPRDRLPMLCGCNPRNFDRALGTLIGLGKIIETAEGLTNNRVSEVCKLRTQTINAKSQAAKSRWEKAKEKQSAPDNAASDPHMRNDANQNQNQNQSIPVDKSTGPDGQIDPVKIMFDSGRALLMRAGKTADAAGKLLGKWRGEHGTEAVIAALGQAQREGAIDPVAFIEGALRHSTRKAEAGRKPEPGEIRTRADGTQVRFDPYNGWHNVY